MSENFRVHGLAAMKQRKPGRPRKYPVTADQVIPSLWTTAMSMAHGDGRLIEIVSKSQVVIHPNLKSRRTSRK